MSLLRAAHCDGVVFSFFAQVWRCGIDRNHKLFVMDDVITLLCPRARVHVFFFSSLSHTHTSSSLFFLFVFVLAGSQPIRPVT